MLQNLELEMKLSKRNVAALPPQNGRYFVWDDELSGFGLRVEESGRKTFLCRYRKNGVRRQYTLGRYGNITPDEARTEAKKIIGAVAFGQDPSDARNLERCAISFNDLFDIYLREHGPKLKESSKAEYQRAITKHALPAIGRLQAEAITRQDLNKIHLSLADRPHRANRVISYLGGVFSWAASNGYLPEGNNPARSIKRFREQSRQRYLTEEELSALGNALRLAETSGIPWITSATGTSAKHTPKSNPNVTYPNSVTNAIRLLLFTGCRLREILNLRWKEVDLQRGFLFLPDSKTGQKAVVLNEAAISILRGSTRESDYVIPGDDPDHPRHDLKRPWKHIRAVAGIEDVRLHDLRHTHASVGAAAGFGLQIVGKLLGHSSPQTTQRYAHLADTPVRRASNAIGSALELALTENKRDDFSSG